ncbi:hypothetical protein WJX72_008753 [[Myrmecia] bisecta]|uniref:GUN4-like domain-containing protein n=1 Tax=[Myrmecia] bisecta TaxID=41462 RepID=A0AAW1PFQ5_9CHLO
MFEASVNRGSKSSSKPATTNIDDVPLESEANIDYEPLREALRAGEFQKADDETRALLIKLAGPEAVKRNWVYFSEVQFISAKDLRTIDALWRAASNGKFGFSVQKEVLLQNSSLWTRFFKAIDWVQGENSNYRKWPMEFNYSLDAVKGHLPLTNCLRGTQLFKAILDHPAFADSKKMSIDGSSTNGSTPSWLK